jgi:hypothetical protein
VIHGGESLSVAAQIAWVEIEPADGAHYLLYFNTSGECLADTWHESAEQAKAQARFEFEIEESDWKEVSRAG